MKYKYIIIMLFQLIISSLYADLIQSTVTAKLESKEVEYICGQYSPPEKIEFFSDGENYLDTPKNVVISQYTQMNSKNWEKFVSTWDDYYLPYTQLGIDPPAPEKFMEVWDELMSKTNHFITYQIEVDEYLLFVVDTRDFLNQLVMRNVSTVKKIGENDYRLTRDLSMESDELEQIIDDFRFDPEKGEYNAVKVSGALEYNGKKSGTIYVAAARQETWANWDTDLKQELQELGNYSIPDVIIRHNYVMKAFMDADQDGFESEGDPIGYYVGNPIHPVQDDYENIDIKLYDPPIRVLGRVDYQGNYFNHAQNLEHKVIGVFITTMDEWNSWTVDNQYSMPYPDTFEIDDVPSNEDLFVKAYLDFNQNGLYDNGEPVDFYNQLPLNSDSKIQGLNISLKDPVLKISGKIEYLGAKQGQINVSVVPYALKEFWYSFSQSQINVSGPYVVNHIVPDRTYIIKAYMDVNNDKQYNSGEPYGEYLMDGEGVLISEDLINIDIKLLE